jgi:hypothetical protein
MVPPVLSTDKVIGIARMVPAVASNVTLDGEVTRSVWPNAQIETTKARTAAGNRRMTTFLLHSY